MRRLAWFTLGFAVACGVASYFLWDCTGFVCVAAWILCGCITPLCLKWDRARIGFLLLSGFAVGMSWFLLIQNTYWLPLEKLDGRTVELEISASDYSEQSLYGTSLDGSFQWNHRSYRARIYLKGELSVEPGQILTGSFRVRLTTPQGQKESTYYQGNGILAILSQSGELEIQSAGQDAWKYLPQHLGYRIRHILITCMPQDAFPFAQSLLLGDSSALDYVDETSLRVSGIRHIIAVSGLHVAVLYGLIVKLTGNRRYLTFFIGIPALLLFSAVAGFTPSVCRASIMLGLMMLAGLAQREYDALSELSFAALLLLGWNPFISVSVSFQLSVASVLGILLFQPVIYSWLEKKLGKARGKGRIAGIRRWVYGSVSVTLGAMTLSTPLSAYYFGMVSLVGVMTNLLVLWMVAAVFYGILGTCILGCLWIPAGKIYGWITAWGIRYILAVAGAAAKLPMAAVYTCSEAIVLWICFCYLLLLLALVFRKGVIWKYLLAAGVSLCAAVLVTAVGPRTDICRLTVLDVGEGQSILLQSKGESFLVDCGGNSDSTAADAAAEMLLSQSIYHLDGIALTHLDADHTGGIPGLLSRVDAKQIILSETEKDRLPHWDTEAEIQFAENEMRIPLGDGLLTFFTDPMGKTDNEKSMAILFETESCAILITGDRSKAGEKRLVEGNTLPQVDVLIAGHHGSKYSTSEALLEAVQPEVVVISSGRGNSYGHPAPELLERLASHGCRVLRTDQSGTVVIRR